jgi:membrane associated rhomboid family serine protease
MGRVSEIVKHLIIINVIFFIASIVFGELMYDLFAMHYPNNSDFIFWQPVTHMFMHGDITHILFNMFGLWMFGTPLEQMWGKQKFVFFYLSAGFGAVLIQTIVYHYDVMLVTQILIDNGFN